MKKERISVNLQKTIQKLMNEDEKIIFLGEDVKDPYGGAFKISKGLSDKFPERVINTPISEEGFVNMATGMSLMGFKPIVDMMFSDFSTLAFDPLINFASKSVSMYGKRLKLSMIIRTANGGYRGYGATHSQSMQKFFMGVQNLNIYELTPFHNNYDVFLRMFKEQEPCIFFEEKIIYSQYGKNEIESSDLFNHDYTGEENNWAVSSIDKKEADIVLITHGGLSFMCLEVMEQLIVEAEIEVKLLVPSKLYPFDLSEIEEQFEYGQKVLIVEESTKGGSWGESLAYKLMYHLRHKNIVVEVLSSDDEIIPASSHYEHKVLVGKEDIYLKVLEIIAG